MNRRTFLASAVTIPATVKLAEGQITHVDTVRTGEELRSSVVACSSLGSTGDSPGARTKVSFNGLTRQLATLAAGVVTLEPGARPHPPHRHAEEELMVVTSGVGEIEVAGVITQVKAGDMMYAEANVLHGILNNGKEMMTFYFVNIEGRK